MSSILIYQQIAKVMGEVSAIPKSRSGQGLNYKFRGIDDFMNALNPIMSKNQVIFGFDVINVQKETFDQESNYNGNKKIVKWTNVSLTIKYIFFAADGSSISVVTIGEGRDNSDKAYNKAMSAALKYALMQVFLVPTEDLIDQDDERPGDIDKNQPVEKLVDKAKELKNHAPQYSGPSEAQIKRLYAICKKSNWTQDTLKDYLKSKYSFDSVSKLTQTQYNEVCSFVDQSESK